MPRRDTAVEEIVGALEWIGTGRLLLSLLVTGIVFLVMGNLAGRAIGAVLVLAGVGYAAVGLRKSFARPS